MQVPDRILALGGAGKEMTYHFLEQEWVLRDVLRPRETPRTLTVQIIDTAVEESESDQQRINDIRERVAELKAELQEETSGRLGDVDLNYKLLTEDIELNDRNALIGEDAVPRITRGVGMDENDWWLDTDDINENLDFATGVIRKRGLAKAIYYKAYAEDDEISSVIDLPEKGKIAMVVGLGGGTGSGVMMDIVQHLKQRQRTAEISLFGVLPNHTEGDKEATNAYAALSELEYLSLDGDTNLFKDMVLLPIDPTGFDGKQGNRIQTSQYLEELDEAFVYTLLAYYNNLGSEDPFDNAPQYAPFTVAIPQVLRYNVEAISEARETLQSLLETKQAMLAAERDLYSEIGRYLADYQSDEDEYELNEVDEIDLTERVEAIRSLLELDLFEELDYESVSIFREFLDEAEERADDISERIDILEGSVKAVDTSGRSVGGFVDENDEMLAETLEQDVRMIAERKERLAEKQAISDNRIRNAIEYLLSADEDGGVNAGVRLRQIESNLEDIRERRERLESNLEETEAELEEIREEQAEEIDRKVDTFARNTESQREQLQTLAALNLVDRFEDLRAELDRFSNEVGAAANPQVVDDIPQGEIADILDDIGRDLDRVGISFQEERTDIEQSLNSLRQARKARFAINQEEGFVDKIKPWASSVEEEREQAQKDFRRHKSQLDNAEVFDIGAVAGPNFNVDVSYSYQHVLDRLDDREAELVSGVVHELQDLLAGEVAPELRRELESEATQGADASELRALARRAFEDDLEGTDDLEATRRELEDELETAREEERLYEATLDLFDDLSGVRTTYQERTEQYREVQTEYLSPSETSLVADDDYVYVQSVQPENVIKVATGGSSLADSDVLRNEEEANRLYGRIRDMADKALDQKYNGLRLRRFHVGRKRYQNHRVRVGVLSPAIDQIDPEVLNLKEKFAGAFDINQGTDAYTAWQEPAGGPWDIGVTMFVDGVFLDNIRKVVQPDGYETKYRQLEAAADANDLYIHHSYGLEENKVIRRDQTLNLEKDGDAEFFLRDERDVVDDLLDEHVEVVDVESQVNAAEGD